jgi:hypothetical protein
MNEFGVTEQEMEILIATSGRTLTTSVDQKTSSMV